MRLAKVWHTACLLTVLLLLGSCGGSVTTPMPNAATSAAASVAASSAARPAQSTAASVPAASQARLNVVATHSILGDLVGNVAGDRINLRTLAGPDRDPHVYQPTPQDRAALADAKIVFENGLQLEPWLDDLYTASGSNAVRVVTTDQIKSLPAPEEHAPAEEADDETPTITHRLVVGDAETGKIHIVDLNAGAVLSELNLQDRASLYTSPDGRYAFAVQGKADRVDVIDSGVWEEPHGDHAHFRARHPTTLRDGFSGNNPVHFVPHGDDIAVFYDDDGNAVIYDAATLDENQRGVTLATGKPHHGVAVPFADNYLLTVPDPALEDGALPNGVNFVNANGDVLQQFAACPELHGEAAHDDVAAFACADGVLLLSRDGDTLRERKATYPASDDDEARAWSFASHEAQPFLIGDFEPRALSKLDLATGTIGTIAVPTEAAIVRFALDLVDGSRLLVLTSDGTLHLIDAVSGTTIGSVPAVDPINTDSDNKDPRPTLTTSQNVAYVSQPLKGEIVEIMLDDLRIGRRIPIDGKPQRVALVGLLDQPVKLDPVPAAAVEAAEHNPGADDPHVWNDPNNAMRMVEAIRDALAQADPANAATYQANAAAYLAQLRELDTFITDETAKLPEARRKLVTTHATFGYFAARYGYEIVGAATPAAADPAADDLAQVVEQIKAANVAAVFTTHPHNGVIEQIARDAGVQVAPPLYAAALSAPGGEADTYLKLVRYNVQTISAALGE